MKKQLLQKAILGTLVVLSAAVLSFQLNETADSVTSSNTTQEQVQTADQPILLARRGTKTADGNINRPPKSSSSSSKKSR